MQSCATITTLNFTTFHHLRKYPVPISIHSPLSTPSPSPWQSPIYFVSMDLSILDIYKSNHTMQSFVTGCFHVALTLLRFIHAAAYMVPFLFVLNCGEIYVTFTILTIFKCAVQWHEVYLHYCVTISIRVQSLFILPN